MIKKIKSTLKNYTFSALNFRLILYTLVLSILGVLAVGSAAPGTDYRTRQIFGLAAGIVAMLIFALISYKLLLRFFWPIYIFTLVLLIAVEISGKIGSGAERWFEIAGFRFQPSEIAKIFLLIFLASYLSRYKDRLNTFRILAPLLVLVAVPIVLILMEPDLSTAIVIFATVFVVIFLAGLNYKIILGALLVALPVTGILGFLIFKHPEIQILSPHQYDRLFGFFNRDDTDDPEIARILYQQENALLAFGSGGLTGKGLYNDDETSVKNGNLLPEAHTDFIFTIIGEELGFIGCLSVIVLLLLIVIECFLTGAHSRDPGARLFCYGIGSLIAIQSFVNIAVNTMLLPNTGLTLPFVSYGLTSLISLFIGIGIVLNIGLQTKKKLY